MTPYGEPQTMQLVQPNVLHCPGLSVRQDDGLADNIRMSLFERVEDHRGAEFHNWHCLSGVRFKQINAGVPLKGAQVVAGVRQSGVLPGLFGSRRAL